MKCRVMDAQTHAPVKSAQLLMLKKTNEEITGLQSLLGAAFGGGNTDDKGEYTFDNLVEGDFILQVIVANYAPQMQEIHVGAGVNPDLVILLSAGGSIKAGDRRGRGGCVRRGYQRQEP